MTVRFLEDRCIIMIARITTWAFQDTARYYGILEKLQGCFRLQVETARVFSVIPRECKADARLFSIYSENANLMQGYLAFTRNKNGVLRILVEKARVGCHVSKGFLSFFECA
jgi:hypothetical protein